MSFEESIVPEGSSLEMAFGELEQAELAMVEAQQALQSAAEALSAARQKASAEMEGYFVGKHVRVTGYAEEETAYYVGEGWLTEKSRAPAKDETAVVTAAGVSRAHYASDASPRLTMEMKDGPRKGSRIRFRLSQIKGLVQLTESQ